jgi:HPt (histidine-containing phosphotransfer) domain-containing protein
MTDEPLLDPGPLRALAAFGADIPREMIALFEEEMAQRLEGLEDALVAGNLETARIHAHSAKGGGGNLGLRRFAEVAGAAEHAARDGDLVALPALVSGLRALYGPSLAALKAEFEG